MPEATTRTKPQGQRPLALGLLFLAVALFVMPVPVRAEVFSTEGVALGGTDPVAYFTEGKPVEGSSDYSFDYQGATWHFASAANRDAFAADPGKYAPQYGGYCAYGLAQGALVETVPEAWSIVDGKLYLNFSKGVQQRWEQDIPGYIAKADSNWPSHR